MSDKINKILTYTIRNYLFCSTLQQAVDKDILSVGSNSHSDTHLLWNLDMAI